MAGERRLNGNFSRFRISNLTDKNDVWVLSQNGSQARGKGNADAVIDGNLNNTVDVVFHRIFGSDDLVFNVVQFAER